VTHRHRQTNEATNVTRRGGTSTGAAPPMYVHARGTVSRGALDALLRASGSRGQMRHAVELWRHGDDGKGVHLSLSSIISGSALHALRLPRHARPSWRPAPLMCRCRLQRSGADPLAIDATRFYSFYSPVAIQHASLQYLDAAWCAGVPAWCLSCTAHTRDLGLPTCHV
jgi:hypothetical protein